MADARSLLKAKRLERGTAAVPTRSATGGLRAKEDERLRKGKRKLENAASSVVPQMSSVAEPLSDKRRRIEEPETGAELTTSAANGGFPADFFSDPSRQLPIAEDDDDDEEEEPSNAAPPTSLPSQSQSQPKMPQSTPANKTAPPSIDDEFAAFERAIQAASRPRRDPNLEAFSTATISAEAELVLDVPDGFPASVLEQREGGGNTVSSSGANAGDAAPEEDKTEIDRRRRKEEEERELIMDRLVEEERAQEDADAKVSALKARLEAIKLKRAAKKAGS
jgi:zinc finger protein 830